VNKCTTGELKAGLITNDTLSVFDMRPGAVLVVSLSLIVIIIIIIIIITGSDSV
jgi:hypothetical protein